MNVELERIGESKDIPIAGTDQTIHARCYRFMVNHDIEFFLYVDGNEKDEITETITNLTYVFPESFFPLPTLLKSSQRVLDLGAHIGTFSLLAAASGCSVIAVEASPRNGALLKESARRNGFDNIRVIPTAIFDRVGELEFIQAGPYGLVTNPSFPDAQSITIPATTGDQLLADIGWDHVDFIKMDIEGAEVAAVQGMSQLLASADAPTIFYESNGHTLDCFGETPASLVAALEAFGYQSYLIETDRFIAVQPADLQPYVCVDHLATKHPLDMLGDWRVAASKSEEELIIELLTSSVDPDKSVRDHVIRTLADADASILSDPRIIDAKKYLKLDADEDDRVRALYQALLEKDAEIARLQQLVDGYEQGRFIRLMKALRRDQGQQAS